MQSSFKRIGAVIISVAVISGSFIAGSRYGSARTLALSSNGTGVDPSQSVDLSAFWKAWDILDEKFVPTHSETIPTDQQKIYGAIQGLASSYGDPYTTFFPPVENQDFQTQISGNFSGVGMEVGMTNNIVTVIAPLKGSPAEKAGVKAGDQILKIGTTTTENMSVDDAVNLMRGPKGTSVTITLLSKNDTNPHTVTITRDTINIPTINTETKPGGIFVIQLYSFTSDSADLFRGALLDFMKSGDNKLILDLRGNPGGYLDAAVDMASWFLPKDKVIVKEDSAGHGEDQTYYSKGYDVFDKNNNKNFKMVVLVDGGSASAAEILSGALQQQGVATLVGTQTFGKGSVQELVNITPQTSLKVTVARWLTPNGTSISAHGLTPDVVVPVTDQDIKDQNDVQMNKAIQILNGQ